MNRSVFFDRMLLLLEHLLDPGLQHLEAVDTGAGPGDLAGQRDDGEAVAVANLDHETVGVVEEELVHLDPPFLHSRPHAVHPHLLQLLLHYPHALALERDVVVFRVDLSLLRQIFGVFRLQQMDPDSITKEPHFPPSKSNDPGPCAIEIERTGPTDGDEAEDVLVKVDGLLG